MNRDAGREMWLFVNLRQEDGRELPFFVDTGTTRTLLDQSLRPLLGRSLGTGTASHFGRQLDLVRYAAPKFYLGGARLAMAGDVFTCDLHDLSTLAGRPVMGILGMDCLKHYCLQLDFQAGKLHFLNPDQTAPTDGANIFPLKFWQGCPYIQVDSLAGNTTVRSLIDTGCAEDGMVTPVAVGNSDGTTLQLPQCRWSGETHSNLCVSVSDRLPLGRRSNSLGLRFLARHLVTLDFPKGEMYLQQTSVGPLVDHDLDSAVAFLQDLKCRGLQPGWSREDNGNFAWPEYAENSFTFHVVKRGDSSTYHYVVARPAKGEPWKLAKAWRTNAQGRLIDDYPAS